MYLSHGINGSLAELVREIVSFYEADAVFALNPDVSHTSWRILEKRGKGRQEVGTVVMIFWGKKKKKRKKKKRRGRKRSESYRDGSLHFDGPLDHPVHDVLGDLAFLVAVEEDHCVCVCQYESVTAQE